MYVTRLFASDTAFLSRFRHCRWPLLSLILGSFFAPTCGEAGQRPTAADLTKVKITLQRSACEGSCPVYKVTIHGDGRVVFTGGSIGVVWPGTHEHRITPETVAGLFERFRKAGFFKLRRSYRVAAFDLPKYVLTIDAGQRHWSVEDYGGREVGMPKVVTELEHAVDEVAGTVHWVNGTGLIAWLEGQNFDFQSPEAAEIAAAGAHGLADETMVLALIDYGAPLDSEVSNPRYTPTRIVAGVSLMESAIRRGQARLFNKLVAAGWIDRVGKETAAQLFAGYAAGCSPALVDAAADAGIDIDEPESSRGRTALAYLRTSYPCVNRPADRVATAERLLARGANPNRRDVTTDAQITTSLSVAEARKLLICKTHMTFSAGHGTQVSYLRSDGVEFLWYPGNAVVVRGNWDIVEHTTDPPGYADICFQYGANTYNPVTGKMGGNWECRPAHAFARSTVDRSDGDVFGLAKRDAVPFELSRERTTINNLRTIARRLGASGDPKSGSDRGCD
ncbi:MAG TPA: DUF6438 domain-containing protein [Xanthobacteraceae bacterium]|nr:DUF6438 domain-containing protein [Xanthobacteraceae bacterium]